MRDDKVYLQHIGESIDLIEQCLAGADGTLDQPLFYEDRRPQDAVVRRLETLAEAASHLSDALAARHPEIPWRQISDFRNVLAHGYTDIRLDRVWGVIVADLPTLKAVIHKELGRASSS